MAAEEDPLGDETAEVAPYESRRDRRRRHPRRDRPVDAAVRARG